MKKYLLVIFIGIILILAISLLTTSTFRQSKDPEFVEYSEKATMTAEERFNQDISRSEDSFFLESENTVDNSDLYQNEYIDDYDDHSHLDNDYLENQAPDVDNISYEEDTAQYSAPENNQ